MRWKYLAVKYTRSIALMRKIIGGESGYRNSSLKSCGLKGIGEDPSWDTNFLSSIGDIKINSKLIR